MSVTDPLVDSDHSGSKMISLDFSQAEGLLDTKVMSNGKECFLFLKDNLLTIESKKGTVASIKFKDIVGAVPCTKKNKDAKVDFFFEVHSFGCAPSSGCCGGSSKGERKKRVDIFQCQDVNSFWNWLHAINCAARQLSLVRDQDGLKLLAPPPRRVLVVANPKGGTGIALKIWKKITEPMLQAASIEYTLLTTEYADHAKEYVTSQDLSPFYTILIIGGDGLIFEVVSGIMARDDSDHIFKTTPLSPIPGGSGNGLAMSILFECGESCTPQMASFVAISGAPAPLDVSTVSTRSHNYFSFLSLSWGLIADVDIKSESMRWMGETRFTIAAVNRVISKKVYRGRLSMLLAKEGVTEGTIGVLSEGTNDEAQAHTSSRSQPLPPVTQPLDVTNDPDWTVLEGDFIMLWVLQTSHASTSVYSGPGVSLSDGLFTITLVRECSRLTLVKLLLDMETGDHFSIPELEVYKATKYRLEPLEAEGQEGIYSLDGELIEYGPVQCEMHPTAALQVMKTDGAQSC